MRTHYEKHETIFVRGAKIPIRKEFGVSSQEKKIFIPIQTFFDSISIYNNNVADWNR